MSDELTPCPNKFGERIAVIEEKTRKLEASHEKILDKLDRQTGWLLMGMGGLAVAVWVMEMIFKK